MADIKAIQSELRASKIDAWLLYDFHHRDPIAYRMLGIAPGMASRRWFYVIPAKGEPRKLVHRIESGALDQLPGAKMLYAGGEEMRKLLPKLLGRAKTLAMQFSPLAALPLVSLVDAGTVDLLRSLGRKVVSSAELVQKFDACWTHDQLLTHLQAGRIVDRIIQQAFAQAAAFVRQGKGLTEYDLQQWIQEQFRANLMTSDEGPIVAVGPHAGDPHYVPQRGSSSTIREGDLLLLDVWGKNRAPGSVYYDVTWMGYVGNKVPAKFTKAFGIVREARDAAIAFVQGAVMDGRTIRGWQVDRAAREVIRKAGLAKAFVHRTGHNIGQEVHGTGANMDSVEMKDDRPIIQHTCFSVEPGVYFADFGVRSEVNVYVADRQARVTGAMQNEIIPLLD